MVGVDGMMLGVMLGDGTIGVRLMGGGVKIIPQAEIENARIKTKRVNFFIIFSSLRANNKYS